MMAEGLKLRFLCLSHPLTHPSIAGYEKKQFQFGINTVMNASIKLAHQKQVKTI
jgi:hypothetical protein